MDSVPTNDDRSPNGHEPPAGLVEGLRLLLGWGRERRLRLEAQRAQAAKAAKAAEGAS